MPPQGDTDLPKPFGPYTLLRRIAVGGMAEVYVAKTKGISGFEKLIAIKVIHPRFSEDEHFIKLLIEEAKISVLLTHVNIGQIFDLGCIDGTYFIAMEYIEGADAYRMLRRATERRWTVPIDLCIYIAAEVCAGLDYAHRKRDQDGRPLKIVHRDISPQNVLVSFAGEVKIVDFGIAKAALRSGQTEAGVIKGKYYYMSPEQAWGDSTDLRSDVFSTGVVLYELFTGEMLYKEENIASLLDRVRKAEIQPPTVKRADVPQEAVDIVMRSLAKKPEHRYQSALEMGQALTQALYRLSPSFTASRLSDWMVSLFPQEAKRHERREEPFEEATRNLGGMKVLSPPPAQAKVAAVAAAAVAPVDGLAPMKRNEFAPDPEQSVIIQLSQIEVEPARAPSVPPPKPSAAISAKLKDPTARVRLERRVSPPIDGSPEADDPTLDGRRPIARPPQSTLRADENTARKLPRPQSSAATTQVPLPAPTSQPARPPLAAEATRVPTGERTAARTNPPTTGPVWDEKTTVEPGSDGGMVWDESTVVDDSAMRSMSRPSDVPPLGDGTERTPSEPPTARWSESAVVALLADERARVGDESTVIPSGRMPPPPPDAITRDIDATPAGSSGFVIQEQKIARARKDESRPRMPLYQPKDGTPQMPPRDAADVRTAPVRDVVVQPIRSVTSNPPPGGVQTFTRPNGMRATPTGAPTPTAAPTPSPSPPAPDRVIEVPLELDMPPGGPGGRHRSLTPGVGISQEAIRADPSKRFQTERARSTGGKIVLALVLVALATAVIIGLIWGLNEEFHFLRR